MVAKGGIACLADFARRRAPCEISPAKIALGGFCASLRAARNLVAKIDGRPFFRVRGVALTTIFRSGPNFDKTVH
jgi:hypothetical protein